MMYQTKEIASLPRLSLLTLALLPFISVQADEFSAPLLKASQMDFGGVGLIQMPTARMAPEGEFSLGFTYNDIYRHGTVSIQLFPWLESTVRYTQVDGLLYSNDPSFSGDTLYTDKGIDFKVRLLEESYWLPETSVGMRDFGGTGLFDSEFIAFSKAFGPVDFTLGVGFGYIGNSGNLSGDAKDTSSDCGRDGSFGGSGGTVDYQRWFTGCKALFGGIEYQTPWEPLRVKLEYDANDYATDYPVVRGDIDMTQKSKFNYGLLYNFGEWGDLRVSYERGTTWSLSYTLSTNFNQLKSSWIDEPKETLSSKSSKADKYVNLPEVSDKLADNAGYKDSKLYVTDNTVTLVAKQIKYRDREEAHERAGRILANAFPTANEFVLIEQNTQLPITETRIDAAKFRQVLERQYIDAKVADSVVEVAPTLPKSEPILDPGREWNVAIAPTLQQSFGGSENFYMYNVGVTAGANYWLTDHFELAGSVYLNLFDNYDQFKYDVPPDGTDLKRVRTLVRQYITDNTLRVNNLQATWLDSFGKDFYYQAYAGYLETMFGGVGTEFLYRPMGSEWALGFDINYVKQRDPDSTFGFFSDEDQFDPITNRPYKVQTGVATGGASVYYQPKWFNDVLFKVTVGQYLAEDRGVTFDVSKQFDSGVIVGAFATFTDLSAEEYGEGSYSKGFYLSIPFDILTVKPSQRRAGLSWLPLSRDGGQMLGKRHALYDITDAREPWFSRKQQAD